MAVASTNSISSQGERTPRVTVTVANLLEYSRDRLAAAASFPRDRLSHRVLHLPRLDLSVRFASQALAALSSEKLLLRSEGDPNAIQAEVIAMDADADGWEQPAVWSEDAGFSSREFDRALAEGGMRGFYHHDVPSWQFFDPAARRGVQTLSSPMGIPPWEQGSPLRLFLHWAYAAGGMRLVHAAALGVEGRGALIAGASGSGTAATALAGLLHRRASAGDDYVAVELGRKVVAHSVMRIFKQDLEGLRRAGRSIDDLAGASLNWHGKIEFDATRLAPRGMVGQIEIAVLLLPNIAGASHTTIEPVSSQTAALTLAPSSIFQLPGDTDSGFRFLADIVRRLPAYRVNLSPDPLEIAHTIRAFLEEDAYAH